MCMEHKITCKCGRNEVGLHFRDNVMTPEVVAGLYCPGCSDGIVVNRNNMIRDNGWIISYDMEVAGYLGKKLHAVGITPEFLFDEGYCTWSGLYPTDHRDSLRERQEILALAGTDKKRYFEEFRKWSSERMERLGRQGWRKAAEGNESQHYHNLPHSLSGCPQAAGPTVAGSQTGRCDSQVVAACRMGSSRLV